MGMERPFPFSANLSSLNRLLMRNDINLEPLWEMVLELNSRTQVLLKRIEATQNLQVQNGVMWVSVGMFVGFCALIGVGRGVIYVLTARGEASGKKGFGGNEVLANGNGREVLLNGHGNGAAKKMLEKKNDAKILALKEELAATREENETLLSFRDEADGLRSTLDLLSEKSKVNKQEMERLTSIEQDLARVKSECEALMETIKTKDIEIGKLQLFETETEDLRSHLESIREEMTSKDEEIESLKAEKAKIESDLETANKEIEDVNKRATESSENEENLRTENSELTNKLEQQVEEHESKLKALQETYENDLSKQKLSHEQEKQSLKEGYEGKIKEATEERMRTPDSVAASNPTETEASPGRRTPTRFLASLKRHSRSSLSGSFTENQVKGPSSKEQKTSK